MRVIKPGNRQKLYENRTEYKLTCELCDCEFVFDASDFTFREKSLYGDAGVKCPFCGREIIFKPAYNLYKEEK